LYNLPLFDIILLEDKMKNIQINFGMPELLVVFSFLMFPMSKWFAITAFVLGVLGKFASIAMELNNKDEESKKSQETFEKLGGVLTQVLEGVVEPKKKSSGSFH